MKSKESEVPQIPHNATEATRVSVQSELTPFTIVTDGSASERKALRSECILFKIPSKVGVTTAEYISSKDQLLEEARELGWRMLVTLDSLEGVGLAANQVGSNKRIFIMKRTNGEEVCCINPRFLHRSSQKDISIEGCLSISGEPKIRRRSARVTLMYLDLNLDTKILKLSGRDAYCAQHEMDHLNGITL